MKHQRQWSSQTQHNRVSGAFSNASRHRSAVRISLRQLKKAHNAIRRDRERVYGMGA